MKALVAGSAGMIGSNVARILAEQKHHVRKADIRGEYFDLRRGEYFDLRNAEHCSLATDGSERVFHLADRTVGIGYSSTHHGQMMTDSLLISLNLLEGARNARVKDYLYVSSSCVYPDDYPLGFNLQKFREIANRNLEAPEIVSLGRLPVLGQRHDLVQRRRLMQEEDSLPLGTDVEFTSHQVAWPMASPEKANEGYGWAKRIAELQCVYYAREYGMRTVIARPANVYGPSYDWSRPVEDMHVIPALICKMLRGDKEIIVWGSGKQTRTFDYEADTAHKIVALAEHGKAAEAYNLGGFEVSIRDLTELLKIETNYQGEIQFDSMKPEGPMRKAQDITKLQSTVPPWPITELCEGLRLTVEAARRAMR